MTQLSLDDISDMEEEKRNQKMGPFPNKQAYEDRVLEMAKELAHCNSYHRMRKFEPGRVFLLSAFYALYELYGPEIEKLWPRD